MIDKPPTLTDLVREVAATARPSTPATPPPPPPSPHRHRGWTSEVPALAKRHLAMPLTLGAAIAVVAALMQMWDYGHKAEDRSAAQVQRSIVSHDRDGDSHPATIGRLRKQLDAARTRIEHIEKQLIELRAKLDNPRRRRR